MLFIENSQKIVGASATRDRTTKIEGNQFIRHNFKLKAIGILLEKEINSNQSIKNKGDLKASQVSEIINEKNFLIKLNTKGFMNKIKDKLAPEVYENFTNRRKSEFTNHLSIIRESVLEKTKVDLHSMGLNINKKELLMVDKASRFDGDYFFFGEVTQKSKFPELMAGLNKFAYKENFNDVSSFKMDGESINHFLNNLKFKYNNVEKLDKIDNYAHRFLYHILDRSQSEMNIGDCFSEGFAFKEERELVFKSISTIINQVNNLENLSHSNVFTMLKDNLTTLNNEELNNLTVSMTSAGVSEMIINKISKINKAQSEVSGEYREIENSLKSLELKIENYSNQKIINDLEEFGGIEEVVRQLELLKQLKSPIDSSKSRIKPKF